MLVKWQVDLNSVCSHQVLRRDLFLSFEISLQTRASEARSVFRLELSSFPLCVSLSHRYSHTSLPLFVFFAVTGEYIFTELQICIDLSGWDQAALESFTSLDTSTFRTLIPNHNRTSILLMLKCRLKRVAVRIPNLRLGLKPVFIKILHLEQTCSRININISPKRGVNYF